MEPVISIVGSILGSLAGKAAEYTVDPIARQLSYLLKHKSKLQNLKDRLQELKDARERVQEDVNAANRRGEDIFSYVIGWLTQVNEKICEEAAAQLDEDENKAKQRCFIGLCPNFKSRYQLSKKAENETTTIVKLLKQKDEFKEEVAYRTAPEGIATRSIKEYVAFDSRTGAFDKVMEAFKDANLSIIGVYGMGGVGKTTLVTQVATQAKKLNLFDEVVMATVAQSFDINEIRFLIAKRLGLKLDNQDVPGMAGELCKRLKKSKKVLVILDDIWEELDMVALGIPYGDEHQGCKILLTSRNVGVLRQMGSLKINLPIDVLNDKEAWSLFRKTATDDIVLRPDLQSTAIEVCKKCDGLPIALVTFGKAMRNKKTLPEWKNALRKVRRPSERNFKGMSAGVYSAIELSYKFLEDEEHQLTFLLCSIMGHDATIEELLKFRIGLGLFHGVRTIEEKRDRVSDLVSNLRSSSLLLDGSTSERFDMHDVVRDVAKSIASRDRHWLALGRDEDVLEEMSDEENMRKYNLISLQYAKVSELLNRVKLECPNLTFFSLGSNGSSLKISNSFFEKTQRLRVLDIAKMQFSSLPSSLCFLKNMHTLCFSGCKIEDIAIVGELENLEILCLRASRIAMLPREIGQLTKLKMLDLNNCESLEVISPNVLSRLSRLEELYLYNSFDRWEVEGDEKLRANASLVELQHLPHLTALEIHIPNEQDVPKELFSEKLEKYKISIGEKWRYERLETTRNLKLKLNKSIHSYDIWVKTLLRKTETLYLDEKDGRDMLFDPNSEGLSNLKHLDIRNDSEVKYIFNFVERREEEIDDGGILEFNQLRSLCLGNLPSFKGLLSYSGKRHSFSQQGGRVESGALPLFDQKVLFPHLEELTLESIPNIETLWHDELPEMSFGVQNLTYLTVSRCHNLKNLFTSSMVKSFVQLKSLYVEDCKEMEEVIKEERRDEEIDDGDILEFNQLRSLYLLYLPSFKGLSYSGKRHSFSQQGGRVESGVLSLFDQKVLFPHLEALTLESIPNIEKLWHDEHPEMPFGVQNLTTLRVNRCHNLKNLFTSSMVKSFVQLKSLYVVDCKEMEEVIKEERREEEIDDGGILEFNQLRSLYLENLPSFKGLLSYSEKRHSFSQQGGRVESGALSLFDQKVELPMLEHLEIRRLENITRLWPNQLADPHSFSKLNSFRLRNCDKLMNVFPLSMLTRLQSLDQLDIWDCDLLEEIFESQQEEEEGSSSDGQENNITFGFPQLTSLALSQLPNLKSFFRKMHNINCPSLKEMHVTGCGNIEIFTSEDLRKDEQEVPNQLPLFWISESTFPTLQELTLGGMKGIFHGQRLASYYFCNLKVVRLSDWHSTDLFPSYLSQLLSFPILQRLEISNCGLKEMVFENGVDGEECPTSASVLLSQITELRLVYLEELMHLWKEKERFQNLRMLHVRSCPKLKTNLVPSSVCFQNLTTLEVERCDGIIKLVTQSTAKSLVQLREMKISACENIEEIIEGSDGDNDEVKDEISFPELNRLQLIQLPKLESFCSSRNHTFGFPSLATVYVKDCPKMKMFSQGELDAPILH